MKLNSVEFCPPGIIMSPAKQNFYTRKYQQLKAAADTKYNFSRTVYKAYFPHNGSGLWHQKDMWKFVGAALAWSVFC